MHYLLKYHLNDVECIHLYDRNKQWRALTFDKFNQVFNMQFTPGIVCAPENQPILQQIISALSFRPKVDDDYNAVRDFFINAKNYFNIYYIDSTCGFGLVANQNIPANTLIGIYSGELVYAPINKPLNNDIASYGMSAIFYDLNGINRNIQINIENKQISIEVFFKANYFGDLSRFALHAPHLDELILLEEKGYIHHSIAWQNVLIANVSFQTIIYNNVPLNYFKTLVPVSKNHLILINYGKSYWELNMPYLFVKNPSIERTFDICKFDYICKKYRHM